MIIPNLKVYQAARAFAQGEPIDEIKELLLNCFDFDEDDAEKVVHSAINYTNEIDGGYSAFINIVGIVLGTKAYRLEFTKKRHIIIVNPNSVPPSPF